MAIPIGNWQYARAGVREITICFLSFKPQTLDIEFDVPLAIVRSDIYIGYMNNSPAAGAGAADIEIAARISNALIVKNINVRAVSDATGIAYPTLRRSLSGGRSLTILELGKIAGAIDVHPSILMPASFTKAA